MGRLAEAVVAGLPAADVRTGRAVVAVEPDGGRWRVEVSDGTSIEADGVVLAAPGRGCGRGLLAPLPGAAEAATLLAGVEYASVAIVVLAFPLAHLGRPLDGAASSSPRVEGTALTACSWSSTKWAHLAPDAADGTAVVRASTGRWGDDGRARPWTTPTWSAASWPTSSRRWRSPGRRRRCGSTAGPRRSPSTRRATSTAIDAVERALPHGIALAGAALRGVGVPACIRSGREAAARVLGPNAADPMSRARAGRARTVVLALAAGLLLAASLPPWGFWPLAFPGLALLDRLIADRPAGSRFVRGWAVGFGLLAPTMFWMQDLTVPGYVVAVAFFAAGIGGATALCPPGRGPPPRPAGGMAAGRGVPRRVALRWGADVDPGGRAGGRPARPRSPGSAARCCIAAVTVTIGRGAERPAAAAVGARRRRGGRGRRGAGRGVGRAAGHRHRPVAPGRVRAGRRPAGHPGRRHRRAGRVRPPPAGPARTSPEGLDLVVWPEDVVDTDRTVTDTELGALLVGPGRPPRHDRRRRRGRGRRGRQVPQRVGRVEPRRRPDRSLREGPSRPVRRVRAAALAARAAGRRRAARARRGDRAGPARSWTSPAPGWAW